MINPVDLDVRIRDYSLGVARQACLDGRRATRGGPLLRRDDLLTVALSVAAFTSLLHGPMLSPLLKDIAADFEAGDAQVGQLATVYHAMAALTAIVAVPLMDRYSRREMLRFECGMLIVGALLTAFAPTIGWMAVGRGLAGIGGAFILALCMAAAGDLFADPVERNRRIGIVTSVGCVASVIGQPTLAQISAYAGWRWAVGATIVPPLIAVIATRWLLGGAPPRREERIVDAYRSRYRQVIASRETMWLMAVLVLLMAVEDGYSVYLGAYLETVLGASVNAITLIFLLNGICLTVGSLVAPRVTERIPKRRAHVTFATLMALNLLGAGVVYTSVRSFALFISITAMLDISLFVITSILLLDSLPAARGAVMALQAAGTEVGLASGAAWGGAALVVGGGDYAVVYRSLAMLLPVAILCLMMSVRSRRSAEAPEGPLVAEPGG